jgi:hypothetical protein
MARPKKDIQALKAIKLNLRFTVNEYLIVCNNADTLGVSIPDYLRKKATGKALPRTKISPDNRKLFIELCRIGNNLNQITKKAHLGGFNPKNLNAQLKMLRQTLAEIKQITVQ